MRPAPSWGSAFPGSSLVVAACAELGLSVPGTAAHLMTRKTRNNKRRRYEAKLRLVEILRAKGWEEQRMLDFLRLIDWLMKLPKELNRQLWQDITTRRNPDMQYVSSLEEFLLEKGIEEGMEKGMQKGEATILSLLLETRFGAALPASIQQRIAAANTDQIQNWVKRVLEAKSLDDVFMG